jgi:hypothetical protein
VALQIENADVRSSSVTDIVNRYGINFTEQDFSFLTKKLKLPEEILYSSKAIFSGYAFQIREKVAFHIKAKEFQLANDMIMRQIAPGILFNHDTEQDCEAADSDIVYLRQLLTGMDRMLSPDNADVDDKNKASESFPYYWVYGGQVILLYFSLLNRLKEYKGRLKSIGINKMDEDIDNGEEDKSDELANEALEIQQIGQALLHKSLDERFVLWPSRLQITYDKADDPSSYTAVEDSELENFDRDFMIIPTHSLSCRVNEGHTFYHEIVSFFAKCSGYSASELLQDDVRKRLKEEYKLMLINQQHSDILDKILGK